MKPPLATTKAAFYNDQSLLLQQMEPVPPTTKATTSTYEAASYNDNRSHCLLRQLKPLPLTMTYSASSDD